MRNLFFGGLALMAVAASAQDLDPVLKALDLDGNLTWNEQVLDAPNTGDASNRTFLRGDGSWASVGLQDAAHAILTADASTMSSTYATVLSAAVTVGAADDAVRVDVTALLGWMGAVLYVVDDDGDELWQVESPAKTSLAANQGSFPAGLGNPQGITSHGGAVYVVDSGNPDEMWRCADPTSPGTCVNQGSFPSGLGNPQGITSHGGAVYVVEVNSLGDEEIWRCADPTSPGSCANQGSLRQVYCSRAASRRTAGQSTWWTVTLQTSCGGALTRRAPAPVPIRAASRLDWAIRQASRRTAALSTWWI